MRILFVSTSFPRDLRTYVTGSFQRMKMFIDAIKGIARMDLLFYVPVDVDVSPSAIVSLERQLCKHWRADIRLFLCRRYKRNGLPLKWDLKVGGSLSFFRQDGHADTSYPDQVRAFEKCLDLGPDVIFVHKIASMGPTL